MTNEEKADVLHALELGLDALILERDTWVVTYGDLSRPRVVKQMNIDIEIIRKALEIMRLA